jgi:hypothetical protein
MPEVHAPMTGLEACFEDELSLIPGWHSDLEQIEHHTPGAEQLRDTEQSKAVEENMLLGR